MRKYNCIKIHKNDIYTYEIYTMLELFEQVSIYSEIFDESMWANQGLHDATKQRDYNSQSLLNL